MRVICPQCGKEGDFSYFREADDTGVIAMVVHSYKITKVMFGEARTSGEKCFLKRNEFSDDILKIVTELVEMDRKININEEVSE